jgi:hypothetical protein
MDDTLYTFEAVDGTPLTLHTSGGRTAPTVYCDALQPYTRAGEAQLAELNSAIAGIDLARAALLLASRFNIVLTLA